MTDDLMIGICVGEFVMVLVVGLFLLLGWIDEAGWLAIAGFVVALAMAGAVVVGAVRDR